MNTVKNLPVIKKLIHELKLMKLFSNINPFLLEILVGDMLFGRGLKEVAQNTYAAKLLAEKTAIDKKYTTLAPQYKSADADALDVKYLRVNTLKSTISSVVHDLKALGLTQLVYDKEKIKFKKFCNKFRLMADNQFMFDFHFPNDLILVRSASVRKIKSSDLIKKGKIVMQDKASLLAVEAMQVKPDMTILDACCAPGMKTSAIAAKMNNRGKIFAFDLNKGRLASAEHLLKIQGVKCAKLACQDFSSIKIKKLLDGNKQTKLDAILIDPSCSGSGIHNRPDYKSSTEAIDRLKKLQAFQVALLVHAIDDGHTDNIIYCTCSTATEENEQVIKMSLDESKFGQRWQVAEIVPYWPHRGHGEYEFAPKCIRSDQDCLTNGFFVAKLEKKTEAVKENVESMESVNDEENEQSVDHEGGMMKEESDDSEEFDNSAESEDSDEFESFEESEEMEEE